MNLNTAIKPCSLCGELPKTTVDIWGTIRLSIFCSNCNFIIHKEMHGIKEIEDLTDEITDIINKWNKIGG